MLKDEYDEQILMWCKEEILDNGSKLTEFINKKHENIKYLPGRKMPKNLIAVPDLETAVRNADILVFVIPHQFIKNVCEQLRNTIKKDAFALTLIKVSFQKYFCFVSSIDVFCF